MGFLQVVGLVEELVFEVLEGGEGGGILRELVGEGVEGFFGGVAAGELEFFYLKFERALGAVVFPGAEEDGGVAGEVFRGRLAAGDLAEGFLAEGDKRGFWNLSAAKADLRDDGVGLIGGATETAGPAIASVFGEERIDLAFGGGRKSGVLEAKINRVVVGAFAQPDKEVFLLFLGEREKGIGGWVVHESLYSVGLPLRGKGSFSTFAVVSPLLRLIHRLGLSNPFGISATCGGRSEGCDEKFRGEFITAGPANAPRALVSIPSSARADRRENRDRPCRAIPATRLRGARG